MRRPSATNVYYGLQFLLYMPTWVVMAVYLVRELDLSPLELILMGTAMEAAVFLFEVPTGVVADTYSRKLSLIVGYVGMGVAWMLVGVVSAPWAIIAIWGFWGLAYTFTSGAYQAWITDEVGVENVGRIFLRGERVRYAGAVVGLIGQVAIGVVSLRARRDRRRCGDGGVRLFASSSCPRRASAGGRGPSGVPRSPSSLDGRERRSLHVGGAGDGSPVSSGSSWACPARPSTI